MHLLRIKLVKSDFLNFSLPQAIAERGNGQWPGRLALIMFGDRTKKPLPHCHLDSGHELKNRWRTQTQKQLNKNHEKTRLCLFLDFFFISRAVSIGFDFSMNLQLLKAFTFNSAPQSSTPT